MLWVLFLVFGSNVKRRPLWNWQVWDLGLANHGDCMEVDPRAMYTVVLHICTWFLVV